MTNSFHLEEFWRGGKEGAVSCSLIGSQRLFWGHYFADINQLQADLKHVHPSEYPCNCLTYSPALPWSAMFFLHRSRWTGNKSLSLLLSYFLFYQLRQDTFFSAASQSNENWKRAKNERKTFGKKTLFSDEEIRLRPFVLSNKTSVIGCCKNAKWRIHFI